MKVNRRFELFKDVTDEQWNDWKWQVKNRIETVDELKKYIPLTEDEEEGAKKMYSNIKNGYNSLLSSINRSK